MGHKNILIVADRECDADMLYAVGRFLPGPVVYLQTKTKSLVIMNDREAGQARQHNSHYGIVPWSYFTRQFRPQGITEPNMAQIIHSLLRRHRIKKVIVPANFPLYLAQQLRQLKIKVKAEERGVFPERTIKSADEVKKISAAIIMAEVGLAEGIQALKSAKIGKQGRLLYHDIPLGAEKLRSIIDVAILQAGGLPHETRVACGRQGIDPRELGRGILRANQPIILHIQPRSRKTGYYGNIARTVVKGHAPERLRQLFEAVVHARTVALAKIRDATPAKEVHLGVQDYYALQGFKTTGRLGHREGIIHDIGHGLGLANNEPPRLSPTSTDLLKAGQIVTVEPGLYYADLGGVTLKDVALVTHHKACNLTAFENILEI